jgi:hypothetical protein
MPSSSTRQRIDYTPGDAALEAIDVARTLLVGHGQQDVLDRLVILGLWALKRSPPPALLGNDRHRWTLPAELGLPSMSAQTLPVNPGKCTDLS